tara:strand:- start:2827 stop:4149 length:1323 start_codon:yes stop_codon:yes gene_type:complete
VTKTPTANNDSTAKELYNSRVLYDYLYDQTGRQFDLWYDTPLYGKVDKLGRVVYPKESFLEIVSKDSDENTVLCLNYVSQAFKKMRLHYETLYLDGYLDTRSDYFQKTLQPFKGWSSPALKYQDNQQDLYEGFFSDVLENVLETEDIKDFNSFTTILLEYIKNTKQPFTRVGFHESNNTTVNNTGLAIEIYEGEYGDDSLAFEFVNDNNFEIFQELCGRYGFRIDRNIPWRIVSNFNSKNSEPFVKEQITEEDRTISIEEIFRTFYERLDLTKYFEEFYNELFVFYTTFVQAYPRYKENRTARSNCINAFYTYKDRELPQLRKTNITTPAYYKQTETTIDLYYNFRLAESGLIVSQKRKSFHIKNALTIYKSLRNKDNQKALSKALDYIQYNLGTTAYRDVTLNQNNLTRFDDGVMISSQDRFDKRTGEDNSYLNDFSGS